MASDSFYKHLDECRQCREHPFALCAAGSILLRGAAIDAQVMQLPKHTIAQRLTRLERAIMLLIETYEIPKVPNEMVNKHDFPLLTELLALKLELEAEFGHIAA
jgi:hypothetical protein